MYKEGKATVSYDASKVTSKEIKEAIARTGFKVSGDK
jgi:copper chaperone CopZ